MTVPEFAAPAKERSLLGASIGKYRIVREIGRGGMGAVYEAVHEDIGQRLAVKVLHERYSENEEIVRRFLDEARAASLVSHPGLVKVFDFNRLPDGTVYIMMELIEGESLSARLQALRGQARCLSPAEIVRLGRQLASTLRAVHDKGVTHRDLKPENVLLIEDPEAPAGRRTKIVDFGIAKFHDDPALQRRTGTGVMMGTPLYMSPEQCQGRKDVGPPTDVYALGIMLYELAAGRAPSERDSVLDVLQFHVYGQPPPLQQAQPAAPPALSRLVMDMLARDPAARPTMAQVAERLERIEGKAETGVMVRPGEALAAPRARRAMVPALALLAAALLGGALLWLRRPAGPGAAPALVTAPAAMAPATAPAAPAAAPTSVATSSAVAPTPAPTAPAATAVAPTSTPAVTVASPGPRRGPARKAGRARGAAPGAAATAASPPAPAAAPAPRPATYQGRRLEIDADYPGAAPARPRTAPP